MTNDLILQLRREAAAKLAVADALEADPDELPKHTKKELLTHYAEREPKRFLQFDGFDTPGGCLTDDTLYRTETYELMHGSAVRILIDPEADRASVYRILARLASWISDDGLAVVERSHEPRVEFEIIENGQSRLWDGPF